MGGVSAGLGPPAAAAKEQPEPEENQQRGPQHIPPKPREQAKVLEQVVDPDDDQHHGPKRAAAPPSPWTVPAPRPIPAASLSLRAPVIAHLMAPCPPFVARGSGARLLRRPRGCSRRGLSSHRRILRSSSNYDGFAPA